METPKDKAVQLFNKYFNLFAVDLENTISKYEAAECAKIAVEEIIKVIPMYVGNLNPLWKYWDNVRTELNKL